jgi:hypothetical protein
MKRQVEDIIEITNIDKPKFVYEFPPNQPLVLGDNAEIGLKSYFLWYELPNISEKYENNTVRVKHNETWTDLIIPEGMYEVSSLSNYINKMVVLGKDVLGPNEPEPEKVLELAVDTSTFHCLVKLNTGVQIDFSKGKLHKLLGLEPKIYNTSQRGKDFINITRGVDKIYIRCDLVERKYQYSLKNVLYSVLPVALPGEALFGEVETTEFFPCNSRFIRSITISITDKDNNLLHLNEMLNIKLVIRHHVNSE